VFSLAVSGYLFWQNQKLQKQLTVLQAPTPSLVLTTSPSFIDSPEPQVEAADPTAGWKTYENDINKFSVNYPDDVTFEENQTGGGIQIIFNKFKPNSFTIHAQTGYPPTQPQYFLGATSNGSRKIGEITWNTFYLSKGYQDASNLETTPIYALQLEQNEILYSIYDFKSTQIPEQIIQILSTFKFTE